MRIISICLTLIGLIFLISAYFSLRPSLSVNPIPREGAPLITTGVYKWVRHPMYTGVLLVGASLAMSRGTLLALLIYFLLFITILIKANFEDQLLKRKHPDANKYQEQTRRFI